ncbi:hypothetical protein DV451_004925 [Geotrichum candidum]|uniref:Phospholipid-transporting ATPase n=1 Tax=Geotrichum candidum TaxID=1173061 RepID=A0A9P5FYS8_GEOCN|nr:hypothetical protein DV451_004925 [Geotrichum candidum]
MDAPQISLRNETTKHPRFASDNPFVPAGETTVLGIDELEDLHHRHVHEGDSPNPKSPKSISFKTFELDTQETEEVLDDSLQRNKTVMKRHRWGTQRHKKGRTKSSVKRSKSIFNRSGSGSTASKLNNMDNDSSDHFDHEGPVNPEPHKVFFNMHLPPDMIDDETGAPIKQFMFKTANSITEKKNKKAGDDNKEEEFGSELTTSMTVRSVATVNHEMKDLSAAVVPPPRPFSTMSFAVNDDSTNPFTEAEGSVGSVLNYSRQTPGKAKFKHDYWKNVRVGDFVRINNNDEIPADIVVMATSDTDGACYVETKNLDGETNLKVRQALKCGEGIRHSEDCERATFWIETEPPQPNLYSFNGVAKWPQYNSPLYDPASGQDPPIGCESISINNLLLRGCTLRNTKWVIGVVVFTGPDTKIIINSGETPSKRSKISRELNFSVICNFVLLFILCLLSGIINGTSFARANTSITFFEFGSIGGSAPVDGIVTFWAAVILYQSLVPISLYISIEIVKTIQAFFIYSDVFMYYAPLDYPCTPKSWNISDDLGQIEYVFSDKTGTLTQNIMEFKKCTINGVAYGKAYTEALAGMRKRDGIDVDNEAQEMAVEIAQDRAAMLRHLHKIYDNPQLVDDELTFVSSQFVNDLEGASGEEQKMANQHFMLALALCHSVISEPSKTHPGRVDLKAQSPDEAALVGAARDVGFSFIDRTQSGVIVNVCGTDQEYKILNVLEFNSTRKRMSAIIKFPKQGPNGSDRILLLCKGADSVIYSRLKPNDQELLCSETALHLEQFANEGLRTLCIAQKELTLEEYQKFNRDHEIASSSLTNREEKMEDVADALERDLTLLGGTAIEDRLQDGVPQSIALLGHAGIKLWVLTGDKVETAINIGFSCNLLDNDMELLVLRTDVHSIQAADALLTKYLDKYFGLVADYETLEEARVDHSPPSPHHAVVIDGDMLKLCLDDRIKLKFLLLCKQCKSVLCCRVSPAQKAAVVRLVKNNLGVMTLSIGDGANDVAMIQEADVGVGIAGEEGRAAVMSSDYAIGQFQFLTRLLLVHGRWSYKRLAEMIPNFFYKNVVFALTLFWYGAFSSFDGAYLFEYTYVMFFNLAFTSLPVILMGVFDQDVEDKISLAVPQLYQRGILGLDWSQRKFWAYMLDGVYQSLVSFFFPFFTYLGGISISESGHALNHRFWMGLSEKSYVGTTLRSSSSDFDSGSAIDPHSNTVVVQEEETIKGDVTRSGSRRSTWGRSKRASIIGKDLEPTTDDEANKAKSSRTAATVRQVQPGGASEPHVGFTVNDDDDQDDPETRQVRKSLDFARTRIRNEQQPPRTSLDNIRMSMELDDLTTAEGLIRVLSHNNPRK